MRSTGTDFMSDAEYGEFTNGLIEAYKKEVNCAICARAFSNDGGWARCPECMAKYLAKAPPMSSTSFIHIKCTDCSKTFAFAGKVDARCPACHVSWHGVGTTEVAAAPAITGAGTMHTDAKVYTAEDVANMSLSEYYMFRSTLGSVSVCGHGGTSKAGECCACKDALMVARRKCAHTFLAGACTKCGLKQQITHQHSYLSPYLQCLECGKECTHPNAYNGKCPECEHLITPRKAGFIWNENLDYGRGGFSPCLHQNILGTSRFKNGVCTVCEEKAPAKAPYGTKMGVPCAKPAKKRRTKRELYEYHRDLYLKCEDPEKAKTHLARMLKHVPSGGDNWWWEDDQKARQIAENALRCTPAPEGSRLRALSKAAPVRMRIIGGVATWTVVFGAINLAEWNVTAFVSLMIALLFVSSVVVPLVRAGRKRKR